MGRVIRQTAEVEAIVRTISAVLRHGRQRTDFVRAKVEELLGPHEPLLAASHAEVVTTEEVEAVALAVVQEVLGAAHTVVGHAHDDLWNRLHRPQRHEVLDTLYPMGVRGMTERPPARMVLLMDVLGQRLRALRHEALPADVLAKWADDIGAARVPLADAHAAFERAAANADLARASYRTAVRATWLELPRLKRLLRGGGLTEVQVHEVVPSAPRPRRPPSHAGNGAATDVPGVPAGPSDPPSG
jgi:hypothetical protein